MARRSISALLGTPTGSDAAEDPPRRRGAPSVVVRRGGDNYALVGGAHEGASQTNRDLSLWNPPLRSADADILRERNPVMGRARDVVRNDAYVHAGESLHRDGIVGSVYRLNAKPATRALRSQDSAIDEVWEREFSEEVEAKFELTAESPDNWIDASRMNTLTSLVRLAVGVFLYGGEILATAEWIRERTRPCNTAIQMIECERLSNPHYEADFGRMRGGIERSIYGAPQFYHIRKSHPSDLDPSSMEWTRYPARMSWGRTRVIHIIEQHRIDQTRGISEMVSALKEMRVTKRFRDIVLQNATVNATYAASLESELPRVEALEAIGAVDPDAVTDLATAYLEQIAQYSSSSNKLSIDGVRIPVLYPGQKLQLRPAGKGGPLGTEFENSLLRYIAANLGVSYEELSRDYSKTNYSSARAAAIQTERFMLSRKRMVADRFATLIYRLWFEEMVNKGEIETMKGRPGFYEGMNKDAYTSCEWLGAARGQIDELKETQAAKLRIDSRQSTYEDELGRRGKDWRKVFNQAKLERDALEEMGLLPAAVDNNMMNALSGDAREPSQDSGESEGQ